MLDKSDKFHRRTKSSALSLLRRKEGKDEEETCEESPQKLTLSAAQTPVTMPDSAIRIQSNKLLNGVSSPPPTINPSPLHQKAMAQTPLPHDKVISLEQTVKKFRIFEALRSGDTAAISKAIREVGESQQSTPITASPVLTSMLDDTTILHLAIQCAELPVIEYILSDGAGVIDVNAQDKDGNTPLHIAASQARGPIVRLLLDQPDINDSIANYQGKLPLDLARTPNIFQQLQLSRSLFVEGKIRRVQELVRQSDLKTLSSVLEEPRVRMLLNINGGEFASDVQTVESGGTLLHEAARKKDIALIEVLFQHGADPFRRDRKGRLPQDVTKDDVTRAILKKSPAAISAQRGIQEKAVLGSASQQGAINISPIEIVAGKEGREMKGYLKKWTNYRKGYQLRWFVLEDGVLSYYKNQDDTESACRGAINMKIAKLHMDPTEKTKFDILGKSSVKYNLRANHEVEAKRWFWALNNSIQWMKDQAKEDDRMRQKNTELLKTTKLDHSGSNSIREFHVDLACETASMMDIRRGSTQGNLLIPNNSMGTRISMISGNTTHEDETPASVSYEQSFVSDGARVSENLDASRIGNVDDDDDDDDAYSDREISNSKDAFDITAQSAKLQLEVMSQVNKALQAEQLKTPSLSVSSPLVLSAAQTLDSSIQNLEVLIRDLSKISKDQNTYWKYRVDREAEMRRMWEENMATIAHEQEVLEARYGEAEEKRKLTKRALREVMEVSSSSEVAGKTLQSPEPSKTLKQVLSSDEIKAFKRSDTSKSSSRTKSILAEVAALSEPESDEEFFDAVDAGEVEVAPKLMPPPSPGVLDADEKITLPAVNHGIDISPSFKGYQDGIRKKLKMETDNRPKISLWGILKSMIGKDMTKMTLPVSFNEPTSLLQRCAEDMEYSDLLDVAADRSDATERMVYVAAFAASEYASTVGRVAKPFNPLLGETFEYVRPDKNYRFFIEQVSHHPPIGAAWAESPRWVYWGESAVKSKFYGKSFDINPLGTWFLKLRINGGKEELYTWKKVTTSVIGIITGSPMVENYGPMEVKNWNTGETCMIDFKSRGWKVSSAYHLSGRVNDANGQTRYSIGGRWNNKIYARLTPGYEATVEEPESTTSDPNQAFLVWEANPRPLNIPFNLTPFVVTLNDDNPKLLSWLPPTDSRLRPDQRAMEDGRYDDAAAEKTRVEERQRAKRREREESGEEYSPHWFSKAKCAITGESYWKFNNKYWDERELVPEGKAWTGCDRIFGLEE
ncbi:oxysterol-binding protein [Blumeria hordei DH14]|uniref:Oxysterol-binding protein n=1 Tax=Blumeria graminis f. sp. hordei (strain DH14) TaxID=546991 RepID=N1JBU6_BLUG1|nr:oxysterol-binding protein [Blumeria hordei DH14]